MTANKHDPESKGSNPRDNAHPRRHFLQHAHRDWRVWFATVLMLGAMVIYVMTENLSLRPGEPASQPMPAANAP